MPRHVSQKCTRYFPECSVSQKNPNIARESNYVTLLRILYRLREGVPLWLVGVAT